MGKKVILFTHSQDIDGIGCIVLSKLSVFRDDVLCVPCETFMINDIFLEYYNNGSLYEYDLIFVTDLCVNNILLNMINDDVKLKNKVIILDHHKTSIDYSYDKYDYVSVIVSRNGIKECGTSLFYEYLLNHGYIERTSFLDLFVELTRQYDVWDWKENNNIKSKELNILFENSSISFYVDKMLLFSTKDDLVFDNECKLIIDEYNVRLMESLDDVFKSFVKFNIEICNKVYCVGYVKSYYSLRNEIPDYVRDRAFIDVVMMDTIDRDSVSYRSIDSSVDCSIIAKYFGGTGHKNAASSPKDNDKFIEFMKSVIS